MRGYPDLSFWIPITLAKICFFPIVITFAKNTPVLGCTALNSPLVSMEQTFYLIDKGRFFFYSLVSVLISVSVSGSIIIIKVSR